MPMWLIWLILLIVFVVVEAMTMGLATVWCAVGSAVALVMDLLGAPVIAQVITMIVISIICFIVCIIWIKPIIDKKGKVKETTNADRIIGQEGIVIKAIDPIDGKGQIKVSGQVWSAKADKAIPEDSRIKVIRLEGVKAFVEEI